MKRVMPICALSLALGLLTAQSQQATNQPSTEPKTDKKSGAKQETSAVNTNEVAVIKTTEGEMMLSTKPKKSPFDKPSR